MNPQWQTAFDLISQVAIPAAAIVISTLVAVWLARAERQRAEAARVEERMQIAAARAREERWSAVGELIGTVFKVRPHEMTLDESMRADPIWMEIRLRASYLRNVMGDGYSSAMEWVDESVLRGMVLSAFSTQVERDRQNHEGSSRGTPYFTHARLVVWRNEFCHSLIEWQASGYSGSLIAKWSAELQAASDEDSRHV